MDVAWRLTLKKIKEALNNQSPQTKPSKDGENHVDNTSFVDTDKNENKVGSPIKTPNPSLKSDRITDTNSKQCIEKGEGFIHNNGAWSESKEDIEADDRLLKSLNSLPPYSNKEKGLKGCGKWDTSNRRVHFHCGDIVLGITMLCDECRGVGK